MPNVQLSDKRANTRLCLAALGETVSGPIRIFRLDDMKSKIGKYSYKARAASFPAVSPARQASAVGGICMVEAGAQLIQKRKTIARNTNYKHAACSS